MTHDAEGLGLGFSYADDTVSITRDGEVIRKITGEFAGATAAALESIREVTPEALEHAIAAVLCAHCSPDSPAAVAQFKSAVHYLIQGGQDEAG